MKIFAALSACALGQFADEPYLVEEFNDLNNWIIDVVPNSHNNEYQYYTDRSRNVRVENGHLILTPLKENYQHRDYTSGKVHSKFYTKYGKIEVRAKTPGGRGIWPAIWMMPQFSVYGGWPASGEIDIWEGRGQNPHDVESTIHYGAIPCCDNHRYNGSGPQYQPEDITDSYNTYSLEWTPTNVQMKFNGRHVHSVDIDRIMQSPFYTEPRQPFDQEFYLILNVAVGGNFLDGPDPWDEWSYPRAEMWVDSVKIYEYTGGENPLPEVKCVANPESSEQELCGSAKWACYEQNYAPNMSPACTAEWQDCCYNYGKCSKEKVVDLCSEVFEQYDSQLRDSYSCDFNGNAYREYN